MAAPPSAPVRGCLVDLDGTVHESGTPVPGAADALAALRRAGLPFRFVTNTTRRPRRRLVADLRAMGIDAALEECLTAPVAAAAWLRERGVERIDPLLPEPALEDLADFAIDRERPECVLVGDLGAAWTYPVLNRAFRELLAGAELVAIQRNRFWETAEGPCLDAGAFVAALEYASGQEAAVVGKPSATFFRTAARELGLAPEEIAMIGDDLQADVAGAQRAGLRGVAVRTGKARHERPGEGAREPDAVLDSIADLPRWLGLAGRA